MSDFDANMSELVNSIEHTRALADELSDAYGRETDIQSEMLELLRELARYETDSHFVHSLHPIDMARLKEVIRKVESKLGGNHG